MYVPPSHAETDSARILDLIRRHPFATLASCGSAGLRATHLPLLWEGEADSFPAGRLVGHLARSNRQWEDFSSPVDLLAIFHGPHAYISPNWYESSGQVPTWNYQAVHVYGTPRVIAEIATVHARLRQLVEHFEAPEKYAWSLDSLPAGRLESLAAAVVVFEITVTDVQAKSKLGQEKTDGDFFGVLNQLQNRGELALADAMRNSTRCQR